MAHTLTYHPLHYRCPAPEVAAPILSRFPADLPAEPTEETLMPPSDKDRMYLLLESQTEQVVASIDKMSCKLDKHLTAAFYRDIVMMLCVVALAGGVIYLRFGSFEASTQSEPK